jgi:hypothetical protein
VERKNRTLLDMARTMLDEYKALDRFWAEAINTACYSINRLYLHRILKKTSYELLTGKKPNVSNFRVFGSKCFILVKRGRKSKTMKKKIKKKIHLKRRTMIKGELLKIKTRKMSKKYRVKDRLTQESIKRFKEINP